MPTKSSLAIALSKLKVFTQAKDALEQYPTDSEVAAELLWMAFMQCDIDGKVVADLGAGTGILGIGALLLGAKKVHFVENEPGALMLLKDNLKCVKGGHEIHEKSLEEFNTEVDTVVENPPFGTRRRHADRFFLEKALSLAQVVYSLHKSSTKAFIVSEAARHGFMAAQMVDFSFPLKNSRLHHRRRVHRIEVTGFRFQKLFK